MKKGTIWIALAILLLPILARLAWFYSGVSARPEIATPDYRSLIVPQLPLETPGIPENIKALGGVVVIDYAHENQFQQGEIESLQEALASREGRVEFLIDTSLLEYSLKYASAYVIISPSISFSDIEINLIADFVAQGGKLAVFTDATRGVLYYDYLSDTILQAPDVYAVNPLLARFGISVNNDYLYNLNTNEANFRNVYFDEFGKNELTFGLKQVAFYGTHSVKADPGLVLFLGAESTLSSITDAHNPAIGGAALSEDGNVAAFGDFTFLTSPYQNVADNATLIANLADFLLGGERKISLINFPYLFTQPTVHVYSTSEVQLTAEMIASLSGLQTMLQSINITMQVTNEPTDDGDTIVLGTFMPTEDLLSYIEPFDLILDDYSEFVEAPGFGNVGRLGNGILLFEIGKTGNTLILLADTVEDLTSLLDAISSGSLEDCVVQGNLAICSIGYGGSFSEEEATEAPATEAPADEATPTPEASG